MNKAVIKRSYHDKTKRILKEINSYLYSNKWVTIKILRHQFIIILSYNREELQFHYLFDSDSLSEVITALTLANKNINYIFYETNI